MNNFNKRALALVSVCASMAFSTMASAEQQWSDFSLSYLTSDQYEVGDSSRQFLTV